MRRPAAPLLVMLVGMAAAGPVAAVAQAPAGERTVEELVTLAVAENLELRAARAEVDAASGRLRQAGLRPNPMLDLSGQQNVTGPDNNLTVGLTLPLDLNGRKAGRVGFAERELALRRAQAADRERRLRAEVRLAAGAWLAARRNLGFTEELLDADRQLLRLVQERVRRGGAPPLEESLLQVELNRLEASRLLLQNDLELLGLELRALVGLPPDAPLSVGGDLAVPAMPVEPTAALAEALERRPDLEATRAEVAMARSMIRKEQAEGRWDASLSLTYQRQDFGYDLNGLTEAGATRPIEDVFHYVGAGVTVTLPVRNRNQGNVAAAMAASRAADDRLKFEELKVRREVAGALGRHEAALRARDIYARGVREAARRNLEVVRRTYELGRVPLQDAIAEQRRYIELETGYTESLKQAYDAAVAVESTVGSSGR
jgi:cobalt-zinc-cadmium efflux system outer membrane protein